VNNRLNDIFEWKMTENEAKTLRLCIIWEEQTRKMFPDRKLPKLPTKGDPRKSVVFREFWKLLRMTRGLLEENEYTLYIRANLTIIAHWKGHIAPNTMNGDKAWVRWRVWKRMYDRKQIEKAGEDLPRPLDVSPQVIREIDCTKRFLHEQCEGQPTITKLIEFHQKGKLKRWIMSNKISVFYVLLSPYMRKVADVEDLQKKCSFDPKLYLDKITDDVRKHFKIEFPYEEGDES
jgi:hypothetical protein